MSSPHPAPGKAKQSQWHWRRLSRRFPVGGVGDVLQTWLMVDTSTIRTVSLSAGWLVKSPPCRMQPWLERLLQRRRWEVFCRISTGQIPGSTPPTLNQGSKSLSTTTRSNSGETLPQIHQEACTAMYMYMYTSDTSKTWIQTQMFTDGRGNGQLVGSPTREHYTAFRMNEAAFHFQMRWNTGTRFTLLSETNNAHTHTPPASPPPPPPTTTKQTHCIKSTVFKTLEIRQWTAMMSERQKTSEMSPTITWSLLT